MQIEYEVLFWPVDHHDIRARLIEHGAQEIRKEFTQKRYNFFTPKRDRHEWIRVRTDGPRSTLALKRRSGGLTGQQEIELDLLDFEGTVEFLREAGLEEFAYQESKREVWHLDGCDVDLDQWPHLEPILRLEGTNEETIRACAEKLGMKWEDARFQTAADLYQEKYGEGSELVIEKASRITFDDPNPLE